MQIEAAKRPRCLYPVFLLPAVLFVGLLMTFIRSLDRDPRMVASP